MLFSIIYDPKGQAISEFDICIAKIEIGLASSCHASEVSEHATGIRFQSREEPECTYGLKNRHSTAVESSAANPPGHFQQFGF